MSLNKWDERLLDLARHVAKWSKDPSTQVGCVIAKGKNKVVSMGYNGPPAGVNDEFRDRAHRLLRSLHAEDNAVLSARKSLKKCRAYITHAPCSRCAGRRIQKGRVKVIFPNPDAEFIERWYDSYTESLAMFNEAGVKVEVVL